MDPNILKQIPELIKELISIVTEAHESNRVKRHDFFLNQIEPIHNTMCIIHEDYMNSFQELLELLNTQGDLERTIELLRKRRLVLITKRQDVLAFSNAIQNIKKSNYLKNREIELFVIYAESIRAYFKEASPGDARFSWYSDFINEFESHVYYKLSPYKENYQISSSKSPIELVKNAYKEAIHFDIPKAWKLYSEAFNKLKLDINR